MPKPKPSETHDDYISRCIPIVIAEGTAKDGAQGRAICESMWKRNKDKTMKMKYMEVPYNIKETVEDEKYFYFEGYASTFGNKDLVNDVVVKGAFRKSIEAFEKGEHKVHIRFQHKDVIGVPVLMKEDDYGLFVKGKLPKADTLVSGRVIPQMDVGSIDSMSIGYETMVEEQKDNSNYLKELKLWEFSPVIMPANPKAAITAFKSLDIGEFDQLTARVLEGLLREGVRLSNTAAKKLVSLVKDGLQREVESQQREVALNERLAKITEKELERKIENLKNWRT